MEQSLVRRLIDRIKRVERTKVSWCQAVVTDNSPLTVKLAGSDTEILVQGIDGLGYDVNDVVTVLVRNTDMLALGASTGSPGGLVTYAAGDGLDLSSGIFSVDLKSGGGLKIDATELAADFGTTSGKVAEGSALAAKADLASPAFTGNPTAPTQSAGNNSTRVATTAYADGAVSTASTADRNRANHTGTQAQSTVTNLTTDLAAKAAKGGETYTGTHNFTGATINVPTASPGDADNSAASTAFVDLEVGLAAAGFTVRPQADYATVQALDAYTGTGTGTLEASVNGDLLDALGLESEHWDYSLSFAHVGTPYAIARDSSGNFYITSTTFTVQIVAKFDSSGQPVNSFSGVNYFGANGSGNGQFGRPCNGITVDSSGNIYVADSDNKRIQKFNSSGVYQAQVGAAGSGNGQFGGAGPIGMAVDSSNNVFVCDISNHRVQKFNSSLTYQSQFGTEGTGNGQFNNPSGIAIDSSGNAWVTDTNNHRVQKFNSSGTYQSQFGSYGVGDGQFALPRGIATDTSNNIYVCEYGARVQKFNSSGVFQAKVGSFGTLHGQFRSPAGVATDASGNLFVCDTNNNRVEKFLFSGVSPVQVGQSVIVKDQNFSGPHVDHGTFEITATGGVSAKWRLERRDDMDTSAEIMSGLLVNAKQRGPIIPGGMWYVSTADPITIDSTPIVWEQFLPGGYPTSHATSHLQDGDDPIPIEDWTSIGDPGAPAFANSWTNFGSGYNNAGYYKDPLGIVHLRGLIKSGTVGSTAFTLPSGYRPPATCAFPVASNAAFGYLEIGSGGVVIPRSPSNNTWVTLEGITFRAA